MSGQVIKDRGGIFKEVLLHEVLSISISVFISTASKSCEASWSHHNMLHIHHITVFFMMIIHETFNCLMQTYVVKFS